MKHIILTGIDKSGKSTLAREMSKRFYMPVVNRLLPKKNIFIECIDFLTDSAAPMIVDRFHLDEEVYGPIKRGCSRFDFRQLKIIELMMLTHGTVNIFTYGQEKDIKDRFIKDKESFLTLKDIKPVLKKYEEEIVKSSLKWFRYKIGDDIEEFIQDIQVHILKHQDIIGKTSNFVKYRTIGSLYGKVLMVGDKYGDMLLPPLVPFGNNAPGLSLFEAIEKSELDWNDVILTNAFKSMPNVNDYDALEEELNLPFVSTVLCLGNNSYNAVIEHKEKLKAKMIYKIPHPSSAFVYQHQNVDNYAMLIDSCI